MRPSPVSNPFSNRGDVMKLYALNYISEDSDELACWGPVRVFPTRERAEAVCRELGGGQPGASAQYEVAAVEVRPVAEANARSAAARQALDEALRAEFLAGCRDLFERHPKLTSFSWAQDTVLSDASGNTRFKTTVPLINGVKFYDLPARSPLSRAENDVSHFISEFNNDLESLFGSGARVTVDRDGVVRTEHDAIDEPLPDDTFDDDDEDSDDEDDE
jgi:hypothetical protein